MFYVEHLVYIINMLFKNFVLVVYTLAIYSITTSCLSLAVHSRAISVYGNRA